MPGHWPTVAEFRALVLPHLVHFPRFPDFFDKHNYDRFIEITYCCTAKNKNHWKAEQRLRNLFGMENCDWRSVYGIAIGGAHSYSILKQCLAENRKQVRGLSPNNGCAVCTEKIQGRVFYVEELLGDYEKDTPSTRQLPHTHCEHAQADGGGWCRCIWTMGPTPPPPGVSREFMKYLRDLEAQYAISPGSGGRRRPPEPWDE